MYKAKFGGTKIKVAFRLSNLDEENKTADANVYFMAPSFSKNVPVINVANGDFELSTDIKDYSNLTVVESDKPTDCLTIQTETNKNNYIRIDAQEYTSNNQIRLQMSSVELKGNTKYKLSYKIKGNATSQWGRVDLYLYKGTTKTLEKKNLTKEETGSLGTYNDKTWTEYMAYFTTSETQEGEVARLQFWTNKGFWNAIDDVVVSEADNESFVYQNGVRTTEIVAGKMAAARYHNASAHDTIFMVALYNEGVGTKTLNDVMVVKAVQNGEDAVIEFTVPDNGMTDSVKVFAWNMSAGMQAEEKAKTVKVKPAV